MTNLWGVFEDLQTCSWIDLTHAIDSNIPKYIGFNAMQQRPVLEFDTTPFSVSEYLLVGQYGTHVDVPGHMVHGGRFLDDISIKEFMFPLCVINVSGKVAFDHDYALSIKDIMEFEDIYGKIPEYAFVAMRTDWYERWPNQSRFMNYDAEGVSHCPGWSLDSLKFLFEKRTIRSIGHETLDTDHTYKTNQFIYSAEEYVLKQDTFQIEAMANLDKVPSVGSIIICTFPKIRGATGFPARCFAICP